MTVRKTSWHYRLHTLAFTMFNLENYGPIPYIRGKRYEHKPKNLCEYFWSTVILSVLLPFFLIILGFIALLYFVIAVPCMWIHFKYRQFRPKKKGTSIVGEFVHAKKSKICPLITLSD